MTVSEEFRKYLIDVFNGSKPNRSKFEEKLETAKEYYLNKWLCEKLHDKGCEPDTKYYVRFVWIMYHCFCKIPFSMELTDELNKKYIHNAHPDSNRNLILVEQQYMKMMYIIILNQYTETYANEVITCDNELYEKCNKMIDKSYNKIYDEYYYEYHIATCKLENAGKKILNEIYEKCHLQYDDEYNSSIDDYEDNIYYEDNKKKLLKVFNQQEVPPCLFEGLPRKYLIDHFIEKLNEIDSFRDQLIEKLKENCSERDRLLEQIRKFIDEL